MLVRILTALVGIPLFLGLLYVGKWPLFALVAGMGLLGFHEYANMWQQKGVHVAFGLGGAAVLAMQAWSFLAPGDPVLLGLLFAATGIGVLCWLLFNFARRNVVDAMVTMAGVVYVGWLLSHMLLIRGGGTGWDVGLKWLAFGFLSIWSADSFAYFAGRAFGKRKLAPAISPGKSVEGAIGGAVATVPLGWLLAPLVGIAPWQGALISVGAFVLSVLGDLAESALKRYCGVKDSGKILPGHGGVLDRFDSSLFVLPYVYYVARLFFL
ncbi:MAG TPA: phosphatidate cytidylyltransferase [Symbiobacteriaceae bacterium]|nr:phosphatidate cytidylyltransferase [Symbiobacteriaceae bacterium]